MTLISGKGLDSIVCKGGCFSQTLEMLSIAVKTEARRQILLIGKEEVRQASERAFDNMLKVASLIFKAMDGVKRISFARPDLLFKR